MKDGDQGSVAVAVAVVAKVVPVVAAAAVAFEPTSHPWEFEETEIAGVVSCQMVS
jgi:hypothetical protein